MICLCIQNKNREEILELLERVEMAEIRLDLCELSDEDVDAVFVSDTPLIATYRTPAGGDYRAAEAAIVRAVKAGARYADLEIEAPKAVSKRIASACAEWGTTLIRSFHDFESTPSAEQLRAIVDKCRMHDGQVVKIVTTALSSEDCERVLDLYKYYTPESLVAFAMGAVGMSTRLGCLAKGAPFSYACLGGDDATAAGQIPYDQMYQRVYGNHKALDVEGLRMPASKSYAQRAVVAAALADGTSTIAGFTSCSDSDAAVSLAESLGATVERKEGAMGTADLQIKGIAATPGCLGDAGRPLMVGESGLLTRLMLPLASQLYTSPVTLEGCGTLVGRNLGGAADAMRAMGAEIDTDVSVPVTVKGPLKAGRITVDGSRSSQIVSGALMAMPLSLKNTSLSVKNPTSIPYIYMTMDILRKFGVKVRSEMYGGRKLLDENWDECTEILLKIKENQRYAPASLTIEGDWSAATVFLAAGAIFGSVALEGLDTTSLQADLCMVDILMDAGASISQLDEPRGTITVKKSPLQAIQADLSNSPDLFPVVAVLCAFCQGRSTLGGVHRLVHKESDRAQAILDMLMGLGVQAAVKGDQMVISGESWTSRLMCGHLLKGGSFTSSHDHRMVMALSLAALGASSAIEIDDMGCVAKSFPEFNDIWNEYIRKKL